MSIEYRYVPLESWPGKRTPIDQVKQRGTFRIGYAMILIHLEHELRQLGAKEAVFEAYYRRDQLRKDDLPRAGEVPTHHGIVVSFRSKHGPLRVACDRFRSNEHNLRAISLHLEHLRLASLYGVGESGQQYKGWLRLEAGGGPANGERDIPLTLEQAFEVLVGCVNEPRWVDMATRLARGPDPSNSETYRSVSETYRSVMRRALAAVHPDTKSGDRKQWDQLQWARAVLDKFYGVIGGAA